MYKHIWAKVPRSRKPCLPKDDLNVFAYSTQNSHCNLSETSLEFSSRVEFEFVIVISIREANLRTHMLKIQSLEVIFHLNHHFK